MGLSAPLAGLAACRASLYGIAVAPVLIWLYLLIGRGQFWRVAAHQAPDLRPTDPRQVAVVIPARNEADVIGAAVTSLATPPPVPLEHCRALPCCGQRRHLRAGLENFGRFLRV